jgi:hypothetical protein
LGLDVYLLTSEIAATLRPVNSRGSSGLVAKASTDVPRPLAHESGRRP